MEICEIDLAVLGLECATFDRAAHQLRLPFPVLWNDGGKQ
jgi:hypothetical protein